MGWTAMAIMSLLLMVMTGVSARLNGGGSEKANARAMEANAEDAVGMDHWDCWLSSKLILTS
jgi:hypothetical protein